MESHQHKPIDVYSERFIDPIMVRCSECGEILIGPIASLFEAKPEEPAADKVGMIPVSEIVSVLRDAIAGKLPVKPVGPTWNEVYAGDVQFWFGDWKIEIFNDCDSFDYINSVEAPDGRRAVFEDWWGDREIPICPENQLTGDEIERLVEFRVRKSEPHQTQRRWPSRVLKQNLAPQIEIET
jgi:hypothetical protein